MSCNSPIYALSQKGKDGKERLKFLDKKYAHLLLEELRGKDGNDKSWYRNIKRLPCGRCVGCMLDYSRMWSERCQMEMQYYDEAYFVTFTYDDEKLPVSYSVDDETGEAVTAYTLCQEHMQKFFHDLRKTGQKVRYLYSAEYGGASLRPHYHAIIFGLHLDDLTIYKRSSLGHVLYNSQFLTDLWSRGFVVIGEVTYDSAAYVARYALKKVGQNREDYKRLGIVPPFMRASRRPGLGRRFWEEHRDEFVRFGCVHIKTNDGSITVKPPRYFDKILQEENSDLYEEVKKKRALSGVDTAYAEHFQTDIDEFDLDDLHAEQVDKRINFLKGRKKV